MQKKARQDNKGGKDPENDEKKLNIKEEEQSELMCSNTACKLTFHPPIVLPLMLELILKYKTIAPNCIDVKTKGY